MPRSMAGPATTPPPVPKARCSRPASRPGRKRVDRPGNRWRMPGRTEATAAEEEDAILESETKVNQFLLRYCRLLGPDS
jgi:hypothetical protein